MKDQSAFRKYGAEMSDMVLEFVMLYIQDPRDRDAMSLVCRRWYEVDSRTRKHVTIALCYSSTPKDLRRRFTQLESIKLKGKPRASMFNLVPEDWGGYATPWIQEFAESFNCLQSLHFRRMIVTDSDLEFLAQSCGRALHTLKLDKCSGCSTDGLLHISLLCRKLKTLVLDESEFYEKDGEWLHELAVNNTNLETLNFYMTDLGKVKSEDLELIARNCCSLVSVKISDCEISDLVGFFRAATRLQEFCGGYYNYSQPEKYSVIRFPPKLCQLGLSYIGNLQMHIIFPVAKLLKKLDLLYALLNTEDHCRLIQMCPNLEVLEVRSVIDNRGLEVVAQNCKKLRRLRIERGADGEEMDREEGIVSQRGLIFVANGCLELEYLAVYVTDITNETLECFGRCLTKLYDFRMVLLERRETVADLPLDNGVRALLLGCQRLVRFALYLRPGGLTDEGLRYIGQYSPNVRWMLLGPVGESDVGLLELSRGCPKLQKLELRGCNFTERALGFAVILLGSLRYLWVQGYKVSESGHDLKYMAHSFWNVELIVGEHGDRVIENPAHILAYHSLAGQRKDFPDSGSVVPLVIHGP